MIEPVREAITIPVTRSEAFAAFVERLSSWWPPSYTWSGDVLDRIAIEPKVGGRCLERGPHGFEVDWGRVLSYEPPSRIVFTWQISPRREPVPDPAQSSEVEVLFTEDGEGTRVELVHDHFGRHREGAEGYREAMASGQGWAYLLDCYRSGLAV